jgi:hypothetical protein
MSGKNFWGNPLWTLLHSTSSYYDHKNAQYFIQLLICYSVLLPCEKCKKNFKYKLKKYSPNQYLLNKEDLFFYTYLLHDLVNENITLEDSEHPKTSPEYNQIVNSYTNGHNWEEPMWKSVHIFAATLRSENAQMFKIFMNCLVKLLPDKNFNKNFNIVLNEYSCDAYLSSNHDAFFYTYLIHDIMNEKMGKVSENYDTLKSFYFNGLSQECKNCNVNK